MRANGKHGTRENVFFLIDGIGNEVRPLGEQSKLVGVVEQAVQTIPNHVRRRLMASRDEHDQRSNEFALGESVTGLFGMREDRDEVVAGTLPPLTHQCFEVGVEIDHRRVCPGLALDGR